MSDAKADVKQRQISRLLGRGGQTLGLAAAAHARGQRADTGPWHVLSPELVAGAEQLLGLLEGGSDRDALTSAVSAAMGAAPATAAPSWATACWEVHAVLGRIGREVRTGALAPALPNGREATGDSATDLDDRKRGLAALAVALSRSVDGVQALAARLAPEEGSQLLRMAGLAGAQVAPGEPSRMRAWLRSWLAGEATDG